MKLAESLNLLDEQVFEEFFPAKGPGGQHVNKTSSAVRLRLKLDESSPLPPGVLQRIRKAHATKINDNNELLLESQNHRSQHLNRAEAREKLHAIVKACWQAPKRRRPTKPTKASVKRRLDSKKRRSALKESRSKLKGSF